MSNLKLYLPAKGNVLRAAPRLGYPKAPQMRRRGYKKLDVVDSLNNADFNSFVLRWCELEMITPTDKEYDTWLDRCLLKDTKCEDIEILLIMKEGKSIHPNSIKLRNNSNGEFSGSYKVALYNRKTETIMFIYIVCKGDVSINLGVEYFETKADNWYQQRTPTKRSLIPSADVEFWRELKKILNNITRE